MIDEAIGSVNTAETYEMPGLDIQDFVGSFLNWFNYIEVLYVDEYKEMYRILRAIAAFKRWLRLER